jgi:hypothetical protein
MEPQKKFSTLSLTLNVMAAVFQIRNALGGCADFEKQISSQISWTQLTDYYKHGLRQCRQRKDGRCRQRLPGRMGARVRIKGVTANLSQRPALNWLSFTLTLYQSRDHRVKKKVVYINYSNKFKEHSVQQTRFLSASGDSVSTFHSDFLLPVRGGST